MQQKKEISQASGSKKQKRNSQERKVSQIPDRKVPEHRRDNRKQVEDKSQGFKGKYSSKRALALKKVRILVHQKKRNSQRFEYEDDHIFWCRKCNLPLIGEECGRCGSKGEIIRLSQPADVRFCSPYEREVLDRQLYSAFGCNPLGDRLILLNKIPGEDKTDEVLVDGFIFGILRFELSEMDYSFEPSLQGAKILLKHAEGRKVELKKTNRHLNGKNVAAELVESFDGNIKAEDFVLVTAGSLTGYGISYIDGKTFPGLKTLPENLKHRNEPESSPKPGKSSEDQEN